MKGSNGKGDIPHYTVRRQIWDVSFDLCLSPMEPYELDGEPYEASKLSESLDFADVRGQESVKRAISIAAAGSHNLLQFFTV